MKIVIDQNIPFIKGVLEPFFDVCYLPGNQINHASVTDADALIIRTRTKCDENLLRDSKVSFIGSATIGCDHVDLDYCAKNDIKFVNAPGCNSAGVQQWVLAAIIEWAKREQINISGLTLGVVGVGNVGSKVVSAAKVLGMNVLCCDPPRKEHEGLSNFVDLKQLLANSDIVTFHVPLTHKGSNSTYHLINEANLNICKSNVYLLNASRGEVGDTSQILQFAEKNPASRFSFDVWENEPNISEELLNRSLIATPHIAGYSLQGKVIGTKMVIDALSEHFKLSIHPWLPEPNPLNVKLCLPADVDVIQAISSSYNILNDDLRKNTIGFEKFRNTYNFRNDFSGYAIPKNCASAAKLKTLGFGVI